MVWQWHELDHMQIICTSLQTDNMPAPHQSIFFTGRMFFLTLTNSVKAHAGNQQTIKRKRKTKAIELI